MNLVFPHRPLRQFGLRTVFVTVTLLAIAFAYIGYQLQHERAVERSIRRIEELGAVAEFNGRRELVAIDFRGTDVNDDSLAIVKPLSHLHAVWLYDTKVTGKGLVHLQALPKLRTLGLPAGATDFALAELAKLPGIESLELTGREITDGAIHYLLRMPKLSAVELRGTSVTDRGLGQLLQGLPNIRELVLWGSNITGEGFAGVAELPQLWRLGLHNGPLTSRVEIERFCPMPKLTTLNLSYCDLGDSNIAHLSRFTAISELYLSRCNLSGHAAEHLCSLPRLRFLDVSYSGFGDEAAVYLSRMPELEAIDLSYTSFGDAGVEQLCSAPRLSTIDLSHTEITDDALSAIARLKSEPLSVSLNGTRVTAAGIASLQSKRPDCQVTNVEPKGSEEWEWLAWMRSLLPLE